jgi:16S rRNA (cytidine1402-2'-O)-methyltransferase
MRKLLAGIAGDPRPTVAFESPYRIRKSLELIAASLPDRSLTVTGELTKLHEEVIRGTAVEVLAVLGDRARGEFTLVISGG